MFLVLVFASTKSQAGVRRKLWGICACSSLFRKQTVDEYTQTTTVLAAMLLTPKNVIRVHDVHQAPRPCEPVWIGCKSFTLTYKLRQLCKRRNSLKDGGIYLHVVSSEYPKLLRAYLDFQVQLIVII
jgi:hypothetical protein